jgi:excisionase family DNA binding protein
MGVVASERVTGSAGEPLLDIDGLATRLGVSARFVRRLVEERRVPFVKLGRLVRFDPVEVEAWIPASRVAPQRTLVRPGRGR